MTILRNRLLAAATLCILGALTAVAATAQPTYDFNLPQQSLAAALRAIGQQTTMNILFEPATVENLTAPAVRGLLSPEEAIKRVLVGTKLVVEKTAANSLLIAPAATAQVNDPSRTGSELRLARSESVKENADSADNKKPDSSAEESENKIQEIIVTAQKRGEERLRDVPLPISVINAENLVANNQLKLQDFFTSVPGITLTTGIFGESQVGIRGIKTTSFEQPVTAVLVDDVPYTMSSQEGAGWMSPDIDPGNLARVEVLRGPQGTLYGASSMGGLIKYVTVDPSPDRVSGRLQVGSTTVKNGDGVGYNVRGSVNVPLSDTLAVRASGFTRSEPGYIDNHILGDPANGIERGVNETDAYGGHVSLLWRPSEQFSAKLSALFQHLETKGAAYSLRPELGDLQQSFLRGSGWFKRDSRLVSATLNAKLGRANLTSVTGYSDNPYSGSPDYTNSWASFTGFTFPTAQGVRTVFHTQVNEKFSQELRVSAPLGSRVEGMLGVFYTSENHTREPNWGIAENPTTGAQPGVWFISKPYQAKYEESAVFANLTVQVTDRFDIQLGGRQGHNSLDVSDNGSGAFQGDPSGTIYSLRKWDSGDDAFTYSVGPRFKPSPDMMVYGRLASGYRSGAPTYVPQGLGLPDQYGPDKTLNYEIGVKGDLLDRVISFDASLYYIDWKDIQTSIFDSRFLLPYVQNVGVAKSQGVDLSVDFRPRPGLTVTAWGAWNDAVFTKDFELGGPTVVAGDRLPNSPRWSGRLEMDQKFPLSDSLAGVVGGSVTYTGDRIGPFFSFGSPDPTREVLPSFVQTDVHAGVQHDAWTVNFFVTNVTDKRSVYAGGHGGFFGENHFLYSQPRTMGLSLSRTF